METKKYPTLRKRLALTLIALAALFAAGVSYVLYINFQHELEDSLRHRLENITSLARLQQDGDIFKLVQSQNDEYFNKIHEVNLRIKKSEPELVFVYTMRQNSDGIYFVVDAGSPGEADISPFGDIYKEPSETLVENFNTMTGTIVEDAIYKDEFGEFLSAYTPIFTSNGERVGVLGIDISASTIRAREQEFILRLVTIYLLTLPLLIVGGILSANYLAKPIVRLRDAADRVSKGDFSFQITNIPGTRELAELAVDFNKMTENLSSLINDLEQRVTERTEDITRKTDQLRAASFIARQTAEVQDLSLLMNIVVKLVTDQFGYYHTGILLMNETGNEVILHAASSEGGAQMIEQGYFIKAGSLGIVGSVAAEKRSRIALDVGQDAIIFNNPNLPMTRSEIALPLLVRGKILGVLDIQSDKPQAFNMEDIDVLETLADQVAVAIDNARLLDESQAAFLQLEALTAVRTRDAWDQKLKGGNQIFTYTPLGILAEKPSFSEKNSITIPISLRGQKIGGISIARKEQAKWSKLDENLIDEVATQAGLAVDNIRLLEVATQRAKREQIVGEMAFRFNQALDIDTLLQTATRELGQLPGVEETIVFIGDISNHETPTTSVPRRTRGGRRESS